MSTLDKMAEALYKAGDLISHNTAKKALDALIENPSEAGIESAGCVIFGHVELDSSRHDKIVKAIRAYLQAVKEGK